MLSQETDYMGPKEVVKPLPEVMLGYFGRKRPQTRWRGWGLPCLAAWLPHKVPRRLLSLFLEKILSLDQEGWRV